MATGTVKWFSNAKGYGFISPDLGGGDVFAHFSAITMEGYRTLRRGQKVAFEVADGPKGLLASNITITGELPIEEQLQRPAGMALGLGGGMSMADKPS